MSSAASAEFALDVRRGLTKKGQKELYSKYLYDEVGSALFDAITVLPEYGLTRADARLLRAHSPEIVDAAGRPSIVIELGSGSGIKTEWILSEVAARHPVTYCPIDISESALERCVRELDHIKSVTIAPFAASYLDGLHQALRLRRDEGPALVLFLGSTIGNFDPTAAKEFLISIRQALEAGDLLYLSTDIQKEVPRMIAAYDDAIGVTGAFNMNLLARINRELGGNIPLSRFQHEARWNAAAQRIEMHLRSVMDQTVSALPDLVVPFRKGETIWTESSYKFHPEDIVRLARLTGFHCEQQWIDGEWPFAQSILRAETLRPRPSLHNERESLRVTGAR